MAIVLWWTEWKVVGMDFVYCGLNNLFPYNQYLIGTFDQFVFLYREISAFLFGDSLYVDYSVNIS